MVVTPVLCSSDLRDHGVPFLGAVGSDKSSLVGTPRAVSVCMCVHACVCLHGACCMFVARPLSPWLLCE